MHQFRSPSIQCMERNDDKLITTEKWRKSYRHCFHFCIVLPWLLLFFVHVSKCPFTLRTKAKRRTKGGPISLLHLLDENRYKNFERRPVIYNFYHDEYQDGEVFSSIGKQLDQKSVLRVWAELWAEAGWNPTLLTVDEAKKHPEFRKYEDLFNASGAEDSQRLFYLPYLAMCTVGGGWLAKLNVLPLHPADENSDTYLPNGGGFTSQDQSVPNSFLSGNEKEWNHIVRTLAENVKQNEYYTMKHLLRYKSYHAEDSVLRSNELSNFDFGPSLCENTKNKRAVRYNYGEMEQKVPDQLDYAVLAWIDARKTRCQSEVNSGQPNKLGGRLLQNTHHNTDSKHIPFAMIIGAQKAATSLLYQMLQTHPMIAHDEVKEKHYFNNPLQHSLSNVLTRENYQKLFPITNGIHLAVDGTPEYMTRTDLLPQIQRICPSVKIIASLRDPVDRLFSHYNMYLHNRNGQRSFEDFIRHDIKRMHEVGLLPYKQTAASPDEAWKKLIDETTNPGMFNVARGLYSVQLREWFRYFPRESFLILNYDDLVVIGERMIYNKIISFLGLPKHNLVDYSRDINQGHYNGAPMMKSTTRKMLYDLYKPFNEELSSLLGEEWDGVWQYEYK